MSIDYWKTENIPPKAYALARELHDLCLRHRMALSGIADGYIRLQYQPHEGSERFSVDVGFSSTVGSWANSYSLRTRVRATVEGELSSEVQLQDEVRK
jgi:hypothetical protein